MKEYKNLHEDDIQIMKGLKLKISNFILKEQEFWVLQSGEPTPDMKYNPTQSLETQKVVMGMQICNTGLKSRSSLLARSSVRNFCGNCTNMKHLLNHINNKVTIIDK